MHAETIELTTGARVFVARKGDGDELVLFLHSAGGDHTMWYHQMEGLADRWHVAAYDLRGHGRSSFDVEDSLIRDAVSVGAFAKDTLALIEHLGFRRAHLVGLDLGGIVALEAFKRRSDLVQSLAVAGAWAHHPDADSRNAQLHELVGDSSMADAARQLVPSYFAPDAAAEIVDRAVRVQGAKNKHVFLATWASMYQSDYRRMLELIDVPLALIGGTNDTATPVDPLLTSIHSAVPTSELIVLSGAGHYAPLDRPSAFTRALRSHLIRGRAAESQRLALPELRHLAFDGATLGDALAALLAKRGVRVFAAAPAELPGATSVADAVTAVAVAHGWWLAGGTTAAVLLHGDAGASVINAARARVPLLVLAGIAPRGEGEDGRTKPAEWGEALPQFPLAKAQAVLEDANDLESAIDRAIAVAASDPAGPVVVSFPRDLLRGRGIGAFSATSRQVSSSSTEASVESVDRAARIIGRAKRPLIIAGEAGRYRGGPEALVQLAQRHAVPVVEHGKRAFFNFPTQHPMHLGFNASPFVKQADLIVAIESHVPWIPAFANVGHNPRVIQIGVDPLASALPSRAFPADLALAGNPALAIRRLTSCLDKSKPDRERLTGRQAAYASEHRRMIQQAQSHAIADAARGAITRPFLSYCAGEAIDARTIVINDGALEPQLVPRRLPDTWFESSIAAAPGWALGAAAGAQLAARDATVVVAASEAAYLASAPLAAHAVAEAHELPIVVIIVSAGGSRLSIERVADSCGGTGLRVDSPRELPPTLRRALTISREQRVQVIVHVLCA